MKKHFYYFVVGKVIDIGGKYFMSKNVKIGGTTYSGVDTVKLEDADSPGTYDEFSLGGGGGGDEVLNSLITRTITSITNNASIIGSYAFQQCSLLTTVNFPSCTTIGNSAFTYCSSLTTASFPACTNIGGSAFSQCFSLTTVSFPVCTSIGSYAFTYCFSCSLTTVSFPACTNIGGSAFYGCTSLSTASFPVCTFIETSAFSRCTRLTSLYLNQTSKVCSLTNSNAFKSTPIAGYTTSTGGVYGSIYVPASLLASYQTATNWTYFSDRFVGV